ncbi:MAG: LLM class flavin-dependent oxidoreductase [Thermomicrobiales bacterium]
MEDGLSKRERVGLNVRRGRASRAAELIVHAEQSGVSTAWMTMGAMGSDTLTLYAAAAVETETIKLGTSIIPAFTREPFTIATQVLVLDDIAPGRLLLGVGISHGPTMGGIYGVPFDRPLSRLREYLQVLRPVLHDGEVEFRGEFYSVRGRLPGAPGTPVLISALGPKSFETAGELTDGAISWVTPIDYMHETALPAMERGAEKAGRERPDLVAHISIAFADTREEAFEASRKELALYSQMPFYQSMFATAGYPLGSNNEFSDELLDQLVLTGDEDSIGEQLDKLLDSGFDRVIAMPIPVSDRTGEEQRLIELLGRL